MRARVCRWGNSLALRIPSAIAIETSLEEGAEVDLSALRGKLVVRRATKPRYRLADLLALVSDENLHPESWTGARRGRELW
jgi:antitoxin MazE